MATADEITPALPSGFALDAQPGNPALPAGFTLDSAAPVEPDHQKATGSLVRSVGNALHNGPSIVAQGAIGSFYGPLEAAMSVGTGLVFGFPAYVGAAASGLAQKHIFGQDVDPKALAETISSAATYHPHTQAGQRLTDTIMSPLTAVQAGSEAAGHKVTDFTGSAWAGAITDASLQMLAPVLLGALGRKMQGQTPNAEDFSNTAKVIADDPATAATVEANLRETYHKTGLDPFSVAEDARKDPTVAEDLKTPAQMSIQEVIAQKKATDDALAENLSNMKYEQLSTASEQAVAHNYSVEVDAVGKFFGAEKQAEFEALASRRAQDKWLDENITDDAQDYINAGQVNESLVQRFRDAANDFDPSSPEELGRSIAVSSRKVDEPGFMQTPEGFTFRNALKYAQEQGWDMNQVLAGMRSRGAEWAGTDAPELFERLFRQADAALPSDGKLQLPSLERPSVPRAYQQYARNSVAQQLINIRPLQDDPTQPSVLSKLPLEPEAPKAGERAPEITWLNAGLNPAPTIEALRNSPMGLRAAEFTDAVINELQMKLTPMAVRTASDTARVIAKDYEHQEVKARWQWSQYDDALRKHFTPEERARMGQALDEQSVLEQTGQDTTGRGLDRLNDEQRSVIDVISQHGKALWERAKAIGMVEGEGLPSYMPRMAVNIGEDGSVTRVQSPGTGAGATSSTAGRNITTSSPNLLQRKHLTPEETEAAMQAKFGSGATLVTDIRALPLALARFERAIAGRELVNNIKEVGTRTGRELVSDQQTPTTFTIDHPAFKTYRPRFAIDEETGKYGPVMDADGKVVIDRVPIYIDKQFEGPLKAIMSEKPGVAYNALMALKGKTMSVIMYSPLIHNEVEFGRAFALMPLEMSKLGLAKGFIPAPKIYLDGNRLKNDPAVMRDAIEHGLVPIGKRFGFQDITGIMEEPNLEPGRSLTAKAIAAPVGIFSKTAADAVKRGIDTAGDFWHNTLLWDRVGDLQMGLYGKFLERSQVAGMNPDQAKILSAHFANRYAGVLPNSSTSAAFRKASNLIFFSRSFTGGNLGAMKDAFLGVPKDISAELTAAGADSATVGAASDLAKTYARRKAIGALVKDIALAHLGVALITSAIQYANNEDFDSILDGYRDRWNGLLETAQADPWDASNPFADLRSLSPSAENEPGKENRIRVGTDEKGTAIYMRLPLGKIGEEMEGYMTHPIDMMRNKLGTLIKPLIDVYNNDQGFGHPVYQRDPKTVKEMARAVFDSVMHIALDQFPVDSMGAATNIVSDIQAGKQPKIIDELKALGPLSGVTFSRGASGGPAIGEMFAAEQKHRDAVQAISGDVHKLIADGNMEEANKKMADANMTPSERRSMVRYALNPTARLNPRNLRYFAQIASEKEKQRLARARAGMQNDAYLRSREAVDTPALSDAQRDVYIDSRQGAQ